jgi:RNA polymerase sigma factor (sigma-70 family)
MQNTTCYIAVNQIVKEVLGRYFANRVSWNDRKDYQNDIMEKIITRGLVHDQNKGSLKTLVYSIVNNHVIDQERKRKNTKLHYKDDLSYYDAPSDELGIQKKEELEECYTIYQELLASETELNKAVMNLFYFQNFSNKELATHLAVTEDGLTMRRKRIKARMKKNWQMRISNE